ncbi:MAG: hypothetical protein FJX92_02345 [Bacteroidetes bacterium]|nr:hypothetical protein [Bacteroidota bacterium]
MKTVMKSLFALLLLGGLPTLLFAQKIPCSKTCNNNIKHDFQSCIDGTITGGGDLEKMIFEMCCTSVKVSVKEEMDFGNDAMEETKKEYKFITTGPQVAKLKTILNNLVSKIQKPQGFVFSVYLLDSDVLNAWTCGGKIYFTTEMIDFCKSDDEIACIMGHEISHNLLGHINEKLRRFKASESFPILGQFAYTLASVLTTPFGQEDEAHCDLLGIDLARAAGYRGCEAIPLWNRMAEKSGEYDDVSNYFSSHPHPEKRVDCIAAHIKSTYSTQCAK